MELDLFFGRFHPVLVHLPIGFILLAVVLELLGLIQGKRQTFHEPVLIALALGIVSGIGAIVSGLLLAESGNYSADQLDPHRISGIVTVGLSLLILVGKYYKSDYKRMFSWIGMIALTTQVTLAGHLGGVLTHGSDYLFEYAPGFVQRLAGADSNEAIDISKMEPDSIVVYRDIIQPILVTKCISCHSRDKTSGGLNLESYADLFEEAETGMPIVAQNTKDSELFRRITLPNTHRKFMPTKGTPLTYTETALVKYWIESGADSSSGFDLNVVDKELRQWVSRDYGLELKQRPYYEKVSIERTPESLLQQLRNDGFAVNYLGEQNSLLDVRLTKKRLTAENQSALGRLKAITFLDISEAQIGSYEFIGELEHLTRLDVHETNISDLDLEFLSGLDALESVNLYGTEITAEGLAIVLELPSIRRLYIRNTKISSEERLELQSGFPDIEFVSQFSFIQPSEL